ncbi:UNVERIFIED_CONTAM: hypothetical protein K2H54_042488 [Gekko kuhli]
MTPWTLWSRLDINSWDCHFNPHEFQHLVNHYHFIRPKHLEIRYFMPYLANNMKFMFISPKPWKVSILPQEAYCSFHKSNKFHYKAPLPLLGYQEPVAQAPPRVKRSHCCTTSMSSCCRTAPYTIEWEGVEHHIQQFNPMPLSQTMNISLDAAKDATRTNAWMHPIPFVPDDKGDLNQKTFSLGERGYKVH